MRQHMLGKINERQCNRLILEEINQSSPKPTKAHLYHNMRDVRIDFQTTGWPQKLL